MENIEGDTIKNKNLLRSPIIVPDSPMLKTVAFGTRVGIYRATSPARGEGALQCTKTPLAYKKIIKMNMSINTLGLMSRRLFNESEVLRSLNHPNIVGYRDFQRLEDGRDVLVMEKCDTSLDTIIEDLLADGIKSLSVINIKKMSVDVCQALEYLHNIAHYLHADIKSYNILVTGDFEICKLCDFGVSLPLNDEGFVDTDKCPNATYIGTNLWNAPETFTNNCSLISYKADIYSFGCVLFECITLMPPHMASEATYGNNDNNESVKSNVSESFNNELCNVISTNESNNESNEDLNDESNVDLVLPAELIIPTFMKLTDEYDFIVDLFTLCTSQEPSERPTAEVILSILKKKHLY